jgi:hypothetical protein
MAVLDFCGRSAKDKKTQGYTDLKSVPAKAGYGFEFHHRQCIDIPF